MTNADIAAIEKTNPKLAALIRACLAVGNEPASIVAAIRITNPRLAALLETK